MILVVGHLKKSSLMRFLSLLGQSKFEVLTHIRDVNEKSVDTESVKLALYNIGLEKKGFYTCQFKNIASVVRSIWGEVLENIKLFGLLGEC